ncbi:NAD(P)-dependent oxidoreductase [Aquibium sp. A9E412]|uniref:NAD-dependent epimerase/dehydratase family protein n=1 Tax=Aquibium sp. A9E412 TaxID=2976767 RepID=UPI0025AF1DAE|nr:NAD(P)-dependent oxidoreductase [Aquibium sp. A9E412]MDN2564856.1 NAD(P)-dependent oxidoreductase [Aquibium sp. A9E412]
MSARRVLVVGTGGFIGRHVVRAFAAAGWQVHGLDVAPGAPAELADYRRGSLADADAVAAAVRAAAPEVVVSLAAHTGGGSGPGVSAERDAAAAFAVNVDGLRHLIAGCRHAGVPRLVWASSTTVLGPAARHGPQPLDEDAPHHPDSVYGLTKSLAEQIGAFAHARCGLEVCAVRPTLVLGPDHPYRGLLDPLKALFAACAAGRTGPQEIAWGSHRFDIVHVADAARAFCVLAETTRPLAPLYHVNAGPTDIGAIARVARDLCPAMPIRATPAPEATVFPLVSAARIAGDAGFVPDFAPDAVIRDCIANFAREGEPQ